MKIKRPHKNKTSKKFLFLLIIYLCLLFTLSPDKKKEENYYKNIALYINIR